MVLIPPDAAIRMRMQTEANLLQPVQPVHEIPSDLPELRPGQIFNARIQETLPDNTYRALVAGKQLTLQLPEGAKPGDQMELVVIDRSARVVIARQVEASNSAPAANETAPYAYAKFSPAARMIGQLLPAEGEAPPPAQLNRGQPLLTVPPQSQNAAAMLAPALGKAVALSGVFYEAHQAQWVSGKLPLERLLQEPQGQRSQPLALQNAAAEIVARSISTAERPVTAGMVLQVLQGNIGKLGMSDIANPSTTAQPSQIAHQTLPTAQQTDIVDAFHKAVAEISKQVATNVERQTLPNTTNLNNPLKTDANATSSVTVSNTPSQSLQSPALTQQVPNDLRPLVQQQLEAASSNRVFWHGEVWPRQSMDWEIEWDGERAADGSSEEEAHWRTALSLTTPRLGRVEASLQLSAKGVSIALATPLGTSAADLRDASAELAKALNAAGVPLLGFKVKFENEYPAGQG